MRVGSSQRLFDTEAYQWRTTNYIIHLKPILRLGEKFIQHKHIHKQKVYSSFGLAKIMMMVK